MFAFICDQPIWPGLGLNLDPVCNRKIDVQTASTRSSPLWTAKQNEVNDMNTQATTVEGAHALSERSISSREAWLISREDLLNQAEEIARLRHQLRAERRALVRAEIDQAYAIEEPSAGRNTLFIKQAGYRLVGVVGPLVMAVYLLLQLQKLPNSSLSYSLLSAIISLLFNFSSSALQKTS